MHILWLKTELLHPLDKGGRIRTYHTLRVLNRLHHVTYLTLDDGSGTPDAPEQAHEYCSELVRVPFRTTRKRSLAFYGELARNSVTPLPYAVWKYRSRAFRGECERLLESSNIDVVVCDFLSPAINLPRICRQPIVLFQHNVEADIWRRHWQVATHPVSRAYLRSQWRRMVAFERAACRSVDHVVAVSDKDSERFRQEYAAHAVSAVPTGVDTSFFQPQAFSARQPDQLVFTGSMDWVPNEDGVMFFVDRILPLVRRDWPDAAVTIVGREPTQATLSLPMRDRLIRVTGRVPDIRPFLERAAVVIVPLRIGGGTRLKIFEAMAMGCAVVSTTVGAEGLPVRDGTHLLIADSPEEFAQACVRLLQNPELAQRLGAEAAAYVRTHFGWDMAALRFADICTNVSIEASASIAEES
jgi:sugar transferase (PEP-CTERM/EpsH1 system associated)